jgi:hypothetical protein
MRVLSEHLGLVDAERFIALILREPFDYTKWQEHLYADMSLEELGEKAMRHWNETHPEAPGAQ